jgi:hypothetical protein
VRDIDGIVIRMGSHVKPAKLDWGWHSSNCHNMLLMFMYKP